MDFYKEPYIKRVIIFFLNAKIPSFIFLICLLIGSIIRYLNIDHPGYYFDTTYAFYNWGTVPLEEGYTSFWQNYDGLYDYMPGSLYLLMGIKLFSYLLGGDEQAFVTSLKLFNWLIDLVFVFLIYFISRKYKKTKDFALILSGVIYLLPSLWFISVVWGQIDTYAVVVPIVSALCIYNKKFYLAGLSFALGIWIKWQTIFAFPFILLILLTIKQQSIKKFFQSFVIISFLFSIHAVLSHPVRYIGIVFRPIYKTDIISKGATNFWVGLGLEGKASQKLFDLVTISSLSTILILIFSLIFFKIIYSFSYKEFFNELKYKQIFVMLIVPLLVLVFLVSQITYFTLNDDGSLKRYYISPYIVTVSLALLTIISTYVFLFIKEMGFYMNKRKIKITLTMFILSIATIGSIYYLFNTDVHSRYLHSGLFFLTIIPILIQIKRFRKHFWLFSFLLIPLHISYFINQADTYRFNNSAPQWVMDFIKIFNSVDMGIILGVTQTILILILCCYSLWLYKSGKLIDKPILCP